jgi:hypothetical protein
VLALPWGAVVALAAASGGNGGGDGVGALAALVMLAAYACTLVVGMALALYIAAPLVRVVVLDRFGAAFEVAENLAFLRRGFVNYLMALVAAVVANIASQFGILGNGARLLLGPLRLLVCVRPGGALRPHPQPEGGLPLDDGEYTAELGQKAERRVQRAGRIVQVLLFQQHADAEARGREPEGRRAAGGDRVQHAPDVLV